MKTPNYMDGLKLFAHKYKKSYISKNQKTKKNANLGLAIRFGFWTFINVHFVKVATLLFLKKREKVTCD